MIWERCSFMSKSVYIIAEAGVNHNGSIDMAKELVCHAAQAGVNAIKFQTFKADQLVTKQASKAAYQIKTSGDDTQYSMLKKLELPENAHYELMELCAAEGIEFLSTPFDHQSLNFLVNDCGLKKLKISSGDLTNAPFLYEIARFKIPVILSTGMSTLGEIEEALGILAYGYMHPDAPSSESIIKQFYRSQEGQDILQQKVSLLHCTTEYPTPFNEVNLKAISTLKNCFQLNTGLSDHTPGIAVSVASIALGATIIEKHFTLDKNLPGPDHQASLTPCELKDLVLSIRQVEQALGNGMKVPSKSEYKNIDVARKSLVASRNVQKGDIWTIDNLTTKRPGTGKSPQLYWDLLGTPADRNYDKDEVL